MQQLQGTDVVIPFLGHGNVHGAGAAADCSSGCVGGLREPFRFYFEGNGCTGCGRHVWEEDAPALSSRLGGCEGVLFDARVEVAHDVWQE